MDLFSSLRPSLTFLVLLLVLSVASSSAKKPSPDRDLWTAHGATAATAWGILVPLAIGSSLIRKLLEAIGLPKGAWFQLHRGLNALAAILTIVSFSIAVYTFSKEALNGAFRPHLPPETEELNIAVDKSNTNDAAVQEEALEQCSNDNLQTEEPTQMKVANKSTARIVWEYAHRLLGVGLLALAWWQVQRGLGLFCGAFSGRKQPNSCFLWSGGGNLCRHFHIVHGADVCDDEEEEELVEIDGTA